MLKPDSQMMIAGAGWVPPAALSLGPNEVHVWHAQLDRLAPASARWEEILSPDEADRAQRFRFQGDRQYFTASRAVLRLLLAAYLKTTPDAVAFDYATHGKPSLSANFANANLEFNISHSGDSALLAFTRARSIGVDIERMRFERDLEGVTRRFFSQVEQRALFQLPEPVRQNAFFHCWTRKEAFVKAKGDGLSLPLAQFDVSLAPDEPARLLATRPDAAERERWQLHAIAVPEGYAAALVVEAPAASEFSIISPEIRTS